MSSLIGSILRSLERILAKFGSGVVKMRFSIPGFIEYSIVKLVYIGNKILLMTVYYAKKASRIANLLQISMIDSMIIASLWYGFLLIVLMIIVLTIYIGGGV